MTPRLLLLTATGLLLAACGKPAEPAATAAAAVDECAGKPSASAAEYRRQLDAFTSAPGYTPAFAKDALMNDQDTLTLQVSDASVDAGLNYQLYYLKNCGAFAINGAGFSKGANGQFTATLRTGAMADIPDGTPAFLEVTNTVLLPSPDGGLPKGQTTTVGEYRIRINQPKG